MTASLVLRRLATAAALAGGLGACALSFPSFGSSPSPRDDWRSTRSLALQAADAGRHAAADSLLADFVRRRPTTGEAREALYWRALLQMDPANAARSSRDAVRLLDEYLADSLAPRALEASLLRRTAARADSLERQVASLRGAIDAATSRGEGGNGRERPERPDRTERTDRGREQELARLREELSAARSELSSTKAELDRVKKRLATPRP